jgi:peptidoglycan lytic transglycosylase
VFKRLLAASALVLSIVFVSAAIRHPRWTGANHRLSGLATWYSSSLDGALTANGETYRNRRYTAAHLTLPFGCWVEVTARATGRKVRVRVNDRGPQGKKFSIDLSQAAAHALGIDVAKDRYVDIRIIALPGESPLD